MANKKNNENTGIEYKGNFYNIYFNLNVMEQIQEEYGSVQEWGELTDTTNKEVDAKALKFGLTCMINEGIEIYNEEHEEQRALFTTKQIGRIISEIGLAEAASKVNNTVIESSKSDEKN
jgi:hypothetical protein